MSEDLEPLLDRIRTHIYLNGDRPEEWFLDFDKLRSGRVTAQQFIRVLNNIKIQLTQEEYDALANHYAENGQVNYRHFLDEIHDIFTNLNLEHEPHGTLKNSREIVAKTLKTNIQNLDNEMVALLSKLAYQVRTRAIHIREAYMDFDPHNNGRVTQSQFLRAMPFTDLSTAELNLLVKTYTDPSAKDVNYRKLHLDVNQALEAYKSNAVTDMVNKGLLPHQLLSLSVNSKKPAGTVLDCITRFARVVREQRIRIYDFFSAHDPLNQGLITRSKFEGTITVLGFSWTAEEINYLSEKYREVQASTEYVRYREFCKDVEDAENATLTSSVQTLAVTSEPSQELKRILDNVRHTVIRFRINVLPTFQNFDRQKRGFITEPQFHRALSTLKINITTTELAEIARFYGSDEGLDYFKFVEDVDPSHSQSRRVYKPLGTDKQSIMDVYGHTPTGDLFITPDKADELIYKSKRGLIKKIDEHKDISSLMFAMKQWAIVNSVQFSDFFTDFDKLNCGEIPASQFRSGLSLSTYKVTEDEFDLIVDSYSSDTRQGFVCWRKFCNDIKEAIAPLDLEKTPTVTPAVPAEKYQTRSLVLRPEKDMTSNVEEILKNVANFVRSRRLSLIEQFKDKDRLNHKRTSATGFAQVIQLIGVHISKNEIDTLCTFYNDPNTNFVDYVRFCQDVEQRTGQIFGDTASNSIVINQIPQYSKEESPYLVSAKSTVPSDDYNCILKSLQTYIYKRQIRLNDFFKAFDPLNRGIVTQQKFNSVVGQTGLPLTAKQMDLVGFRFTPPGQSNMFDYRSFCKEINQIFGPTELNKAPTPENDKKVDSLPDPSKTLQVLDIEQERQLNEIIKRMHNDVVTKRMNIQEQFTDYDRMPRKNYITKQQFKQCIARLGLSTSPREYDILCKKYRCTDLDDMNYMAFCNDIEGS
ncbi:EF hand family protein [Trichomonas vaginalis G3]|uniref:EF hand family protein n=1 Tax=Trichomonas vaginalis (strain ATCC PRA-98 / G3) TaxID=412133 RepID=A2FZE8_TRIV3|nr:EF-Hand calcium-binding domain-containing protein 6-related family [Trichomonas vaginalis G3]EAX89722.1 EF hand family protein [Trichomonas vaginalis G3]KAI5548413.1 EF-Hand calcium-binding domain-containing protein 6-related family [Trichomonas vaginalis G3]|eukprot:XP_001302652.1 EF hand family protein [Trichomonas vaginalis G3]